MSRVPDTITINGVSLGLKLEPSGERLVQWEAVIPEEDFKASGVAGPYDRLDDPELLAEIRGMVLFSVRQDLLENSVVCPVCGSLHRRNEDCPVCLGASQEAGDLIAENREWRDFVAADDG